jgi:pyrroline-5-carboxylate reductase
MLLQSGKTPAQLIQDVSSPGGTTVAGLHYFDQSQIDAEIQGVVKRSIERSRELGNKK